MRVDDLLIQNGHVVGVEVSDSTNKLKSDCKLGFDAVILAVGHSARDIYQMLLSHNVDLIPKDFAVSSSLIFQLCFVSISLPQRSFPCVSTCCNVLMLLSFNKHCLQLM